MLRQAFFYRSTTFDVLENLKLLLRCEYPPPRFPSIHHRFHGGEGGWRQEAAADIHTGAEVRDSQRDRGLQNDQGRFGQTPVGAIGVSQVEAPVGSGSAGVTEKWAAGPV